MQLLRKPSKRYFFLFNDILLVTKPTTFTTTSKKYEYKEVVALEKITIQTLEDAVEEGSQPLPVPIDSS